MRVFIACISPKHSRLLKEIGTQSDVALKLASGTRFNPNEAWPMSRIEAKLRFDLREITCMDFPGSMPTTSIGKRHRTNRMQAGV